MQRLMAMAGLGGLLAVGLLGCTKFTRDRFEMIKPDVDTQADVVEILGEPEFKQADQWYYEDDDSEYAARIFYYFDTEIVRAKEWIDLTAGTWEGQDPDADAEPEELELRRERTRSTTIDD
jgi:hypothetical protein